MNRFEEEKLIGALITMDIKNDHSDIIIYSKNKDLFVDDKLKEVFQKRIERNIERLGKKINLLRLISLALAIFVCAFLYIFNKPESFILLSAYISMHFLYLFGLHGINKSKDILNNNFAFTELLIGIISAVVTCTFIGSESAIRAGIISLVAAIIGIAFAVTRHICDDTARSMSRIVMMNRHMLKHPINIIIKNEELQWKQ